MAVLFSAQFESFALTKLTCRSGMAEIFNCLHIQGCSVYLYLMFDIRELVLFFLQSDSKTLLGA